MRWNNRDKATLWHPFTQMQDWEPLVIERADGAYLVDENGKRYLDAISSLWCNIHGHNHPVINQAIRDQLERVAHTTFLGLTHRPAIELAEALVRLAPPGLTRVFYADSGSAAVEIALKIAFQYQQAIGQVDRRRFLHLANAYHGDTLGAVGVGGIELFHRIFGPLIVASLAVEPTFEDVDRAIDSNAETVAAFVVEPLIQGAAGMLVHPPKLLQHIAKRCRGAGILLIADEVATGFGRTTKMFACEHEAVSPDLMCLAKGISGGYLPLSATLTTKPIYEAFLGERRELKQFFHGHTYTANPLACAAGLASLELLEGGALARTVTLAARLRESADRHIDHDDIVEVRQIGCMVGIQLRRSDTGFDVCQNARSRGVMLRPLGDVLVWMPPFCVTDDEVDHLGRVTAEAIAATR